MNPGNNGSDDESETHTTYYRDLLDEETEAELELRGIPRWIAYPILGVCGGIGWLVIALALNFCAGK